MRMTKFYCGKKELELFNVLFLNIKKLHERSNRSFSFSFLSSDLPLLSVHVWRVNHSHSPIADVRIYNPEDANAQILRALEYHTKIFGEASCWILAAGRKC